MRTRICLVLGLALLVFLLDGCEGCRKDLRHMASSLSGLDRVVTLYSLNGTVIKQWRGKFVVEITDGIASFIDENDNEIKVNGTYTVEQVK